MSAILIVSLLLVGLLVASSAALSRTTHKVDSARDTEYLELEGNWIRYSVTGGGPPAMKLAADHPDVVGRLVLVATPADEDQVDLPTLLWLATLPVVGPLFYTLGKFLRFLRKLWVRPFVSDPASLTEEVVDDAGRSTPAAATKTLQVMQREISRGRLVRQARIIKVPVLAIAGEEDQIVDPQ